MKNAESESARLVELVSSDRQEDYQYACRVLLENDDQFVCKVLSLIEKRLKEGDYYRDHVRECFYFLYYLIKMLCEDKSKINKGDILINAFELQIRYCRNHNAHIWTMEILNELREDYVSILIELLKRLPGEPSIILQLGSTGSRDAIEPLRSQLRHKDISVKCYAIQALLRLGDASVFNDLVPFLKHKDGGVRITAADALFEIDKKRAVPLVRKLANDKSTNIQIRVMTLVAEANDYESIPLIAKKFTSSSCPRVRINAAKALGQLKATGALDDLIAGLFDENHEIRGIAAWALGKIGDIRALQALEARKNDSNRLTAWSAKCAIRSIESKTD